MVTALLENKVQLCVTRGLDFIARNQLPSGELPTYVSNNPSMKRAEYIKTIAMSALVPSALKGLHHDLTAKTIINRAISFLLNEREDNDTWRFFGKGSTIIPDNDDIAYVATLLKTNRIPLTYDIIAHRILSNRDAKGRFYTWFPEKGKNNNVDWVTNANILCFLYALGNPSLSSVERWLSSIILSGQFSNGSPYYHSPYGALYFLSRLISDFQSKQFDALIPHMIQYLMKSNPTAPGEQVITLAVMAHLRHRDPHSSSLADKVLSLQDEDGGWPIYSIFKHRTTERYYGSRDFVTSIALEGLTYFLGDVAW